MEELESKENGENSVTCEILQLNLRGTYEYNVSTTICNICKNPLTFHPPDYEQSGKMHGHSISLGNCGHPYHNRCISQWLKKNQTCPICCSVFTYEHVELDDPKWLDNLKQSK